MLRIYKLVQTLLSVKIVRKNLFEKMNKNSFTKFSNLKGKSPSSSSNSFFVILSIFSTTPQFTKYWADFTLNVQ